MNEQDAARYLEAQSLEYVDRIEHQAARHKVTVRIEASAAVMGGLACLYAQLHADGDAGSFRQMVNDFVSEVLDAATQPTEPAA